MPTQTISRCGGSGSSAFPATVLTVGPANTLRGYWRLGEAASPFADSSGYALGPTPMNYDAGTIGVAPTLHVPGLIPPAADDGAIQFNNPGAGNYPRLKAATTGFLTGTHNLLSVMALVKVAANAGSWRAGLITSNAIVAGSPSFENGWALDVLFAGSTYTAEWVRAISFGVATITSQAISAGTKHLLLATYDGAQSVLYVDGVQAATSADANGLGDVPGQPYIGWDNASGGSIYGVEDEVAVWAAVLTPANVATLWAAAN